MVGGDLPGAAEGFGNRFLVRLGIRGPFFGFARGIDAYDAVLTDSVFPQHLCDAASLADGLDKIIALTFVPHGVSIEPNGGDDGTDRESSLPNFVGQRFEIIIADVNTDVRIVQKQIDSVELDSVDLGGGRQIQHGIQIDRGFLRVGALAHEPRPHGVVKFRLAIHACSKKK